MPTQRHPGPTLHPVPDGRRRRRSFDLEDLAAAIETEASGVAASVTAAPWCGAAGPRSDGVVQRSEFSVEKYPNIAVMPVEREVAFRSLYAA